VKKPGDRAALYLDFDGVPGLSWRPYGGAPTQPYPADLIPNYCPYGVPGDRLWLREAWRPESTPMNWRIKCRADESTRVYFHHAAELARACRPNGYGVPMWRSPIHMPRWASRITLELTDVRVQRLNEISEEDANAEGVDGYVAGEGTVSRGALIVEPGYWHPHFFRQGFREAWDDINGKRAPWESNPWVFALSFRRVP
jgi:hypothetical protein